MKAGLHITAMLCNGVTCLGSCYFTPPFKLANITEDKRGKMLHLMVMNSSPGVLDEDDYTINIEVEKKASLHLHTQAYQRLFTMKKGASQITKISLQEGASFFYLPRPVVPQKLSSFTAKNIIHIQSHCTLAWGEIVTCGRMLNGERFAFTSYHNQTTVFIHDKLVVRENLLVQPSQISPDEMGQWEGFTHAASFLFLNEVIDISAACDAVAAYLDTYKNMASGVSKTSCPGLSVRLLGYGAEVLYNMLQHISALLQKQLLTTDMEPANIATDAC